MHYHYIGKGKVYARKKWEEYFNDWKLHPKYLTSQIKII